MKFVKCNHCKNILLYVEDKGVAAVCCGEKMQELVPGTTDGAQEKHVPVISQEGNLVKVSVGSVAHPMLEEHYIGFVALKTKKGFQLANLNPGEVPEAVFALAEGDAPVAAYEYCNLHGLWKSGN